jgi:NCAIR mutase (PurE)-related protein
VRDILQRLRDHAISIDEAERLLQLHALEQTEHAALDLRREARLGIPEIVYGSGKTLDQLLDIVRAILKHQQQAIVTRASVEAITVLSQELDAEAVLETDGSAGIIVARPPSFQVLSIDRAIGILTAGTTDIAVASEARAVVEAMGCQVMSVFDVGIAGFHRHIEPIRQMLAHGVDAIVVVAGMEGALPSVVASLVDVPVIAVPTSTGYGYGGKGVGALTTMLQSCALGLAVVNIDNGVAAGALAALIARRVAAAVRTKE